MRPRLVGVALLFVTGMAHGAPTPADRALATDLFERGRKLVADRKPAEACPLFAESERLDPGTGTLLNLAHCHELEGKTASAWAEMHDALAAAERDGQRDRVAFAEQHIAALAPRLARIAIVLPAELDAVDVEIARDGSAISRVALATALPVDPGPHRLEVRAAGYQTWSTTVDVAEGERREIVVGPLVRAEAAEPPPVAPAPPPPVAPAPERSATTSAPPAPTPETSLRPVPVGAYVAAGIAVAGVVVGAVAGGVAAAKSNDSKPLCDPRCNDEGWTLNRSARTFADVSTVAFVVGGIALATAVVLYVTRPRVVRTAAFTPVVRF